MIKSNEQIVATTLGSKTSLCYFVWVSRSFLWSFARWGSSQIGLLLTSCCGQKERFRAVMAKGGGKAGNGSLPASVLGGTVNELGVRTTITAAEQQIVVQASISNEFL